MRIRLCSDLHIVVRNYILKDKTGLFYPNLNDIDVLVVAGDICEGAVGVNWLNSLNTDIPIIYVFGNHEYYSHNFPRTLHDAKRIANKNVHVLENDTVVIGNTSFHGATLWTDFDAFHEQQEAMKILRHRMNDFSYIYSDYGILHPSDVLKEHYRSIDYLKLALQQSTSTNKIVVTHHAPSLQSCAPMYRHDRLSAGFASNLEEMIEQYKPTAWFHGHMHNRSKYKIGDTIVECNPYGYRGERDGLAAGFEYDHVLELP